MPSRADWRRGTEWVLRLALIAALAVALWRSVRASTPGAAALSTSVAGLGDALRAATASPHVGTVDVRVDAGVSPAQRLWLAALGRAGVGVRWHGTPPALAMAADRAREPVSAVHIRLVGDSGSVLMVSDSVGVIDSVRTGNGAELETPDAVGALRAARGAFTASAPVPLRSERRDVLVLGRAGWESRFVLAALGEAGWHVRARLPVAPGVAVTDASILPLDTARYDAVIALDSSAAELAPQVARFIAQGGGAILAGGALDLAALRAVVPARARARRPGRILLDGDSVTRSDLPLRPLLAAREDAVVLARESAGMTVAVRRAGRGRAAALGYDETWRWRMQGGATGEAAHRRWWSRLVGLVAPERVAAGAIARSITDPAPRAALEATLGPASTAAQATRSAPSTVLPLAMLAALLAALLAETASRRFRGAS